MESKKKRASIKDIATQIGVSTATVSMVLSGKMQAGRVSLEMVAKVKQVAKELNYQPNVLARSLQSGRTQTIGLLVADISNPFFGSFVLSIQEALEKAGYAVIITNTNESQEQMVHMLNVLKNRQVDGYIIVPTEQGSSSIQAMVEQQIPLVLIDRNYPDLQTCSVSLNGYQASFQVVDLLIKKGCKRIGCVLYDNDQSHMTERLHGYTAALKRAGLYVPELIKTVDFHTLKSSMEEVVTDLLSKEVDAFFFVTNSISLMGIRILHQLAVRIPEDVEIVCFDYNEVFEFLPTRIPYILQPIQEMGQKAVQLLLEQIEEDKFTLEECKMPGRLIE